MDAAIVKLLKGAHASGIGCGKPRVLTARKSVVRHVQGSPLPLAASSFGNPALLRSDRVITRRIAVLMERGYAKAAADDVGCLYYTP